MSGGRVCKPWEFSDKQGCDPWSFTGIIKAAYDAGIELYGKPRDYEKDGMGDSGLLFPPRQGIVTANITTVAAFIANNEVQDPEIGAGVCFIGDFGYGFYYDSATQKHRAIDCSCTSQRLSNWTDNRELHEPDEQWRRQFPEAAKQWDEGMEGLIAGTRKGEVFCAYNSEMCVIDIYLDSYT